MSTSYAPYDGHDADPYAQTEAFAAAEPRRAPEPAAVMPYAPPAAPAYAAYPHTAAPAQQSSTSTLAVVAMVLSFIGMGFIGAILGHVALGQTAGTNDTSGRTMALIAIWVGWISFALAVIAIIVSFALPFLIVALPFLIVGMSG